MALGGRMFVGVNAKRLSYNKQIKKTDKMNKILISIFMCIGLFSCDADDYSCDPETNKWVSDNIDDIRLMARKEWVQINDISKQRGAYGAFSIEQKIALWKGKLEETLVLKWSLEEYVHIEKLTNAIQANPDWFNQNATEEIQDQKELFAQAWLDYAIEDLKWSNELIYAIAFTPERIAPDKKVVHAPIRQKLKSRSEIVHECDCNRPESANFYQCGMDTKDCRSANCKETGWKCGWAWSYACNGLCYSK